MKGRPKVFKMQEGDSRPVTRATAARIAAGVREGGTDPYGERVDHPNLTNLSNESESRELVSSVVGSWKCKTT